MSATLRLAPQVVLCALTMTDLAQAADNPAFEKAVAPVLTSTCAACHNDGMASGNLNIAAFTKAASLVENREGWEVILRKVRAGEMPPKGVPRPAALDAAIQFVQSEFDKADRNTKPD